MFQLWLRGQKLCDFGQEWLESKEQTWLAGHQCGRLPSKSLHDWSVTSQRCVHSPSGMKTAVLHAKLAVMKCLLSGISEINKKTGPIPVFPLDILVVCYLFDIVKINLVYHYYSMKVLFGQWYLNGQCILSTHQRTTFFHFHRYFENSMQPTL